MNISDDMIWRFKEAWNAADEVGLTGERVRAGLTAALGSVPEASDDEREALATLIN